MKKALIAISILLLSILANNPIYAQKAEFLPDTNVILLGDQIKFRFTFTLPLDAKERLPLFSDTLTKSIEIIEIRPIDTLLENNTKTFIQDLIITSFDSGFHVIKPITFEYMLEGDTGINTTETEAFLFEVKTVAFVETEDIKDIKDILRVPLTLREILPYILGAIVLAALIFLLMYYLKKRKKKQPFMFRKKPVIPPHIEALNAYEVLRKKKLWQNGFVKDYYTELTDILRVYLERSHLFNAMEMTSDEIMHEMSKRETTETLRLDIKSVLELADLVKFAKHLPLPSEHDLCFKKCVNYVEETKPKTVEQNDKTNE